VIRTPQKEGIQDTAAKRRTRGTPSPKPRKKVLTCVTKLYKTDSDTSDSDFTTHESDKFTGEGDCEDGVDFITQPLKPNDFVLLKLATKEKVEYFIGLIQEMKPTF
jgi:hypothetical protein